MCEDGTACTITRISSQAGASGYVCLCKVPPALFSPFLSVKSECSLCLFHHFLEPIAYMIALMPVSCWNTGMSTLITSWGQ